MTYSFLWRGVLAGVVALIVVLPSLTSAQDTGSGIGVRIQPTVIEERVEPGETVVGTITVTNTSSVNQSFELVTRNVVNVDVVGRPTFSRADADITGTLASWIALTERSIELATGESIRIGYTVSVPEDVPPGTHFGGVFVDRRADRVDTSGAGVGYMVGALMSIQAGGEVIEQLQIREFSTDKALYTEPNPMFTILVENQGNIYDEVQGFITVSDMFGNTVETVEVDQFRAVPGYKRQKQVPWEGEGFHLGRYSALLSLVHGQDNRKTITREVTFWVLPVGQIGMVLGGLIVFLLALYLMVRMYVRKQLARAGYSASAVKQKAGVVQKLSTLLITLVVLGVVLLVGILVFFA